MSKYLKLLLRLASFYNPEIAFKLIQKRATGSLLSKLIKLAIEIEPLKTYFKSINLTDELFILKIKNQLNFCKECGKPCKRTFCSNSCSNQFKIKDPLYHEKLRNNNSMKSQESRDKIKNTLKNKTKEEWDVINKKREETRNKNENKIQKPKENKVYLTQEEKTKRALEGRIKKYGTTKQTSEMLAKAKLTRESKTLEQKQDILEKRKQTCLEKYGYENVFLTPDFKEYRKTIKNDISKTRKGNLKKYGNEHYWTSQILNLENLNEQFLRDNFVKDGYFLKEQAMIYFNINGSTINKYKKKFNIQEKKQSEKNKTQNFIYNNINIENKILNDKNLINPFEIDILLPDHKLAIEYNGLMFHSRGISKHSIFNNPNDDKFKHLKKTELVESKGFKLFHIFESDNLDIWLSMINNHLGLNTRIQARKTEIRSLKYSEVKDFLEQNHLQGSCTSSINYGLFYEQELVEVMTFGKSRFNRSYSYELLRLCSKKYTNVVGGASKLFARFLKDYPTGNIISYANRRFSNGKIYEKLGFNFIRKSEPNYFYFMPNENILYSRNKFQKHKLESKLDFYNAELSEKDNMFYNGFRQIFDSGNLVYEYKRESK